MASVLGGLHARPGFWLLVAAVPASSLMGLWEPMADVDGMATFWDVWQGNLWGDLMFTLGTMGSAWLVWRIVATAWATPQTGQKALAAVAVPAGFLLTWTVYALSWGFTHSYFGGEGSFVGLDFAMWEGDGSSWEVTWDWGKAGLFFGAFGLPAAALGFTVWSGRDRRGAGAASAGPTSSRP